MVSTGVSRWWRWAPVAIAVLSVAMVLVAPLRGAELGDEGVVAMGGWRLLMGQVPGRDFFSIIPPMSFLAVAAAYAVLGVSVWAGRVLAVAYAAGLAAAMLHLASRLVRRPLFQCAALAPLVSCGVAAWLLPSHHWLADLLALSAAAAFFAALDSKALQWSILGGALAAACALTLQDQGSALLAALALWIAFEVPRPSRLRMAVGAASGMAALSGAAALWLLPTVPVTTLINDWVFIPLLHYRGVPGNALSMRGALMAVTALWDSAMGIQQPAAFALWNLKLAFTFAAVPTGALALVYLWRLERERRAEVSLWAAACMAFLVPAMRRPAPLNLEWALPPFALAVSWGLERWREGPAPRRARWATVAAWLVLAVFGGAGLVRVPALLRGNGEMVVAPAGRLGPMAPNRARDLQGLVDAVAANVRADEPLFSSGFIPMVNLLTLHPNPAPFDVFVPPSYTPPEQVAQAITALEQQRIRWIVQPSGFSGGIRWDDYIHEGFRPIWADARFELWKRTDEELDTP